ncbi:MAG: hypothetical protein HRT90_02395 [Candidatus Margulisbacteria bacterium]|nr:hypothetical protein [Candidatus Margulisiibacteriota bacterium]
MEIKEQPKDIESEIQALHMKHSKMGALRSGDTLKEVIEICKSGVTKRLNLIWNTLHRNTTTIGINHSDSLENEINRFITQWSIDDIKKFISRETKFVKLGIPENMFVVRLDDHYQTELKRIRNEVSLFCLSLQEKENNLEKNATPTTVNIYQTNGLVQTGDNAVATMHIEINPEQKQEFQKILTEIKNQIVSLRNQLSFDTKGVEELISESQNELLNPKPNFRKIKGFIIATGQLISTTASLKPAYTTLKNFLKPIGIDLP